MMNIVMLVKNRPMLTAQALTSLAANTDVPWNLTIIDDDSGSETRTLLKSFSWERENVALLRNCKSSGITGQVRNLGVYWSEKYFGRGDWLYLSDNDVFFTSSWSSTIIRLFDQVKSFKFAIIGGQNHPYHKPIDAAYHPRLPQLVQEFYALAGTSQLMRWETWDKYGPLNCNAPGVCQSEDSQFCERIRVDGFKIGAIWPHVVIDCSITNSFGKPAIGVEAKTERIPGVIYA